MSTPLVRLARGHPFRDHRIAFLATLPLLVSLFAIGVASAERTPAIVRLSAAEADRAGSAIRLLPRAVAGSTLVQVEAEAPDGRLLGISADGGVAALADQLGELSGTLTLAALDGSQLRVQLPGLVAAAFAPDDAWLATIDGRGALWRVDVGSGDAVQIADGPYLSVPMVSRDGILTLLAVPSVEAPYASHLVRLDPEHGETTSLSDEQLVYAAYPFGDGDLAVVAHQPDGTVVQQVGHGTVRVLANLGAGAVNVTVAEDGGIAFERSGEGIFVIETPGDTPLKVAEGGHPCFAANGAALLVRQPGRSLVLAPDGTLLGEADELAGFAGSVGCTS